MTKRKLAFFIGSRANYASIRAVLSELKNYDNVEIQIFAGVSAVLDKYGNVTKLIEEDGHVLQEKFYSYLDGTSTLTMASSAGLTLMEASRVIDRYKPDIVTVIGDRFEVLPFAIASVYQNVRLAHTMGGEITGTIDESIRHAVTKLAHIHFPATEQAKANIIKMGEVKENVFNTGCPRIDYVKEILAEIETEKIDYERLYLDQKGVGDNFPLVEGKFLVVMQHPVTTEYGSGREQIRETLEALDALRMPTIMLWPNSDAGSDDISKEIRTFREKNDTDSWLHMFTNLPMKTYITLMYKSACVIGNSSSAIREGAFLGVPVVNIGSRQVSRERAANVIDVDYNSESIIEAIKKQLQHGKYASDNLYGDGFASKKVAKILAEIELDTIPLQKKFVE